MPDEKYSWQFWTCYLFSCALNNNIPNRNSVSKKIEDVNKVNTEGISEIGFPNNKDKGKGKKGGIVGKE